MKSKDLIALLQKEDPSGELEVVMDDGRDIFFLEVLIGYWDGCYTTLIRDPAKKPYYDIVGARYRSDGYKIKIRAMGWEDVLDDDPEAKIEVVDVSVKKWMQKRVDAHRIEAKEIMAEVTKSLAEKKKNEEKIKG